MAKRSIEQLVSARALKTTYDAIRSGARVTIDLSPMRATLSRELASRAREHLGSLSQQQLKTINKSVELELKRIQNFVIDRIREDVKDARQVRVSEGRDIVKDALQRAGVYGDKPFVINTLLSTFTTIIDEEEIQRQAEEDDDIWGFQYVKNTERHAALHNATLPKNDPFWDIYTPPNGYGCKCKRKIIRSAAISYRPPNIVIDEEFKFKPKFLHR